MIIIFVGIDIWLKITRRMVRDNVKHISKPVVRHHFVLFQLKHRFSWNINVTLRYRVMISLLIHQSLRKGEINRVRLQDVELESGSIFARVTTMIVSKTLTYKPYQVMLIYSICRM